MSFLRVSFSSLCLLVLLVGTAFADNKYSFDKAHSSIQVKYNHLGLANQTLRFKDFDGGIEFDVKKPEATNATITIKTASVTSDIDAFDKKLRGEKYFNADKHPEITFKTKSAKQTGKRTGTISGDLTINGITKAVTFDVDYRYSGKHPLAGIVKKYKGYDAAAFGATAKILRSEFGMGSFAPLVSDEVTIIVEMELLKKNGE